MAKVRPALLVAELLAFAAMVFWLWPRDAAAPAAGGEAPGAAAPTDPDPARGALAATGDAPAGPARTAAPPTAPGPAPFTVRGRVLGDPRAPDLGGIGIAAYRGAPGDGPGNPLSGMAGPDGLSRAPAFALDGEPLQRTTTAADGTFVLHSDERHLRLALEHDLYLLALPEAVHVPSDTRQADVVLLPLLGGCLRGQLLGDAAAAIDEVRLLVEPNPMGMVADARAVVGAMTAIARPAARPDAERRFAFRGVLPGAALTLVGSGGDAVARAAQPALQPGEVRDVVMPVQLGSSLQVEVVDGQGQPVAGADVVVQPGGATSAFARLRPRRGRTDADGTCRLRGLWPGAAEVEATAPGHVRATAALQVPATAAALTVRLELDAGGTVTGRVTDAAGRPLAGARVAHHPSEELPLLGDMAEQLGPDHLNAVAADGAATDAEGRYTLTGLADPGPFQVVAAHAEHGPAVRKGVRMGDTGVDLQLAPLAGLRGRAVAAEDDSALPEFTVALLRTSFLVMRLPVRQLPVRGAADGAFALRGLAAGDYTLRVEAEGRSPASRDVTVPPGGELDLGAVALPRGAFVTGLAVDEQGLPVVGAAIRRRQGGLADNPMLALFTGGDTTAHSDDQGRFRLGPLPPGRVQLVGNRSGFAPARSERLQLEAGATLAGVRLVFDHGGSIRGRLELGPGQQAAEFLVMAQHQATQNSAEAQLQGDGAFAVTDLEPGQYTVQAMPQAVLQGLGGSNWRPGESLRIRESMQQLTEQVVSQRCAVRAGAVTEVRLDCREIGLGSRWTVRVEVGGKPLRGGLVEATALQDGRVRTAFLQDGTGQLGSVPAGDYRLQVRSGLSMAPVGAPWPATVPPGGNDHTTTLQLPGGELRGRVVDATAGTPLRGAVVKLLHEGHTERDDPLGMALSDGNGEFTFPGLADGTYALVAVGPGGDRDGTAERRDGLVVSGGAATGPVELRARPAATAAVLVTTDGGSPLAGATVVCVDADGHPLGLLGVASTGPDGRASFGGLPRGAARVVGRAPGFAPGATAVQELDPGRPAEFTLALTSGVPTTVQGFDAAGRPLAGAVLGARWDGGPWLPAWLLVESQRSDGAFALGRLGPGPWEFRLSHPAVGTLTTRRTLGGSAPVTIALTPR